MSEKLLDMKPIRWNSPSSCCCDRTAPMVKLDASHSRQKGLDLDGKASMGAGVTVLFSASKACCSAAPHDQSFDFWVSVWRGQASQPILSILIKHPHCSYPGCLIGSKRPVYGWSMHA